METHIGPALEFGFAYEATLLWEVRPSTGYPENGPPQEQPEALSFAIGILPLGLLANTLTLGTTLLLVIVALRAAIAHRRRRKGLCTKCGYQLIGLASTMPCPECGQNARRSSAT